MVLQIASPYTLPSGLVLPNRLAKAAMAEAMVGPDGLPTPAMAKAYAAWADGGWGLVITGNVFVDERHIGQPGDVYQLEDAAKMAGPWKAWAAASKGAAHTTPVVVQINHPGRQSPAGAGTRGFWAKALAPSAVALQLGPGIVGWLFARLIFGVPRAMTGADIEDVVRRFASMARTCAEAGFDGVELHAAHGYLLAQFLSAKSNLRTDEYGGTPVKRAKIVVDVIKAIRAATPKGFTVGVKFNSVDHQSEAELQGCIQQLRVITEAGIDFLEVSGGSYEDPLMFQKSDAEQPKKSDRTKAREAFFLEFANSIRTVFPTLPLMVTGGFRTRPGMEAAVVEGGCDLVGLGRPAAINPALPHNTVFNAEVKDDDAKLWTKPPAPKSWFEAQIGIGAESALYAAKIREMGGL